MAKTLLDSQTYILTLEFIEDVKSKVNAKDTEKNENPDIKRVLLSRDDYLIEEQYVYSLT